MFSWRMLMITGEARYADLMERTFYNGFLGGLSLDGSTYIYANPLQVREGHLDHGGDGDYARKPWFSCACCPPNVMRTLASLEHYVALSSDSEVRLHQYVAGTYALAVADGEAVLRVATDYPWDGRVRVVVESAPGGPWRLALRIPHWAERFTLTVNGEAGPAAPSASWLIVDRTWGVGDEDLPLDVRLTRADPRVDADRGCVALERGPLVYCLEAVDHPGRRLDDLVLRPGSEPSVLRDPERLAGMPLVQVDGRERARTNGSWWPYVSRDRPEAESETVPLIAVPYFAWGNRGRGAMRVWIPADPD
jgi:DUF1680 family protein